MRSCFCFAWLILLAGCSHEDSRSLGVFDRGLELAKPVIEQQRSEMAHACETRSNDRWPGLTVVDGKVVAARVVDEIEGYARDAGTVGGLGGQLRVVTTAADYDPAKGESAIPGSLRAAVEDARREKTPLWIVFGPELGEHAVIRVRAPIKLPDDLTLDGMCSDVTFESPTNVGQVYVFGSKNVIVERMRFRKTDYRSTADEGDAESTLRLNGMFDRVAILHNDFSECGDGCLDITTSPRAPLPERARVTVAYNRFADHDKTMLFGNFTCNDIGVPPCDAKFLAANRDLLPVFFLTLEGNLFVRTAQRHPRVFGRAMAHVVNNVMALAPLRRADGSWSDLSGVFVADAARAFVDTNLFVPLWRSRDPRQRFQAVWTTVTPGAEAMPEETEGFIRASGNRTTARSIMGENHAELVANPGYREPIREISFEAISPEKAVACVAARAGVSGGEAWNSELCR
jgi:pectate lyase